MFAIQDEIAGQVVEQLELTLAGPELGRSLRYAPRNLQAYEFYLRGRQLGGHVDEAAWRRRRPCSGARSNWSRTTRKHWPASPTSSRN